MATTVLGNVLEFFGRIGVFDVVLPFILVFTIVYAIFERTKILGTEKDGAGRKNLNAMAAFTIAFLTIASSKIVEAITTVSSQIVILLLLGVFFLLLVGTFYKEGKLFEKDEGLPAGIKLTFVIIMLVGILGIFLDAIKTSSGRSWLDASIDYLRLNWSSTAVASIVLILIVIFFIRYLTAENSPQTRRGTE